MTFFENRAVYEIMWKNIVNLGRPQMTIWSMRITFWIPESTNYTLIICNTYWFSTATMFYDRASMLGYGTLPVFFNFKTFHLIHHIRSFPSNWGKITTILNFICGNKTPARCNRWFLLQILLLAQYVSGITMRLSGAREYYTDGCCLYYLVLWFSSCRYGVELRVMCPVCGLLQQWCPKHVEQATRSTIIIICCI